MPRRFSPWNLVERNASLVGELNLESLTRLQSAATSLEDGFRYEISGEKDILGNPSLVIRLFGQVNLPCERCLESMPVNVDCNSNLQLKTQVQAATRSAEHELTDDCDVLICERDEKLDAFELLQDEILLALPLVPAHMQIEDCGEQVAALLTGERAQDTEASVEPKNKPFADLANLLGKAD